MESADLPITLEQAAKIVEENASKDRQPGNVESKVWDHRKLSIASCSSVSQQLSENDGSEWSNISHDSLTSISKDSLPALVERNISASGSSIVFQNSHETLDTDDSGDNQAPASSSAHTPSNRKIFEDLQDSDESPENTPDSEKNTLHPSIFYYQPPAEDKSQRKVICERSDNNSKNCTSLKTQVCLHYPTASEDCTPWVSRKRIMTNFSGRRRKLNLSYLVEEKSIHEQLQHYNICRFLGCSAISDEHHLELVLYTEYCGRHPYKVLKRLHETDHGKHILNWTGQLMDATTYLHENNILHRDIKPDNLAINDEGRLRLFDFGLAKDIHDTCPKDASGSSLYMSPEARKGLPQAKESDLYSLGQTVLRMCVQVKILTVDYPRKPSMVLPVIRFHKSGDHKLEHRKLHRIISGVNLVNPGKREPLTRLYFFLAVPSIEHINQHKPPLADKLRKPY